VTPGLPYGSMRPQVNERNIALEAGIVNDLTPRRSIRDNGDLSNPVHHKSIADRRPLMPLKAVLLDFDGVIAETANHHIAAWQRTLATLGWQISDEVAARSAEIDDRDFLVELFAGRGIVSQKIEEWVLRKQALTVQMLRDSPRLYPGVVELIRLLRTRAKLAVVSATWHENIQAVLIAAGLVDCFEAIVGKEDVTSVKPAAEAYLLALKKLQVSAKAAVAIEDSPAGLQSARAAGIRVVAVGHRHPFGDWVGDSLYVSGFEPVEGLLRNLGL
jgi:HAD superfamily hydrolase (TIGR01509 family)